MSFADTMKRAGDHPNAFILARRMVQSLSTESLTYEKPTKDKYGDYTFTIAHDGSEIAKMAITLVGVAMQKADKVRQDYAFSQSKDTATTSRTGKIFPVQQTLHQLNVLQNQLTSNWVKDEQGNYRHVKVFEHVGLYPNASDVEPSNSVLTPYRMARFLASMTGCSEDEKEKMQLLCKFDESGKKVPINHLPVDDHELELKGYHVGLCLTPEQVGILAKEMGFLNPARTKSPSVA